jgi:hypothetical protein
MMATMTPNTIKTLRNVAIRRYLSLSDSDIPVNGGMSVSVVVEVITIIGGHTYKFEKNI